MIEMQDLEQKNMPSYMHATRPRLCFCCLATVALTIVSATDSLSGEFSAYTNNFADHCKGDNRHICEFVDVTDLLWMFGDSGHIVVLFDATNLLSMFGDSRHIGVCVCALM